MKKQFFMCSIILIISVILIHAAQTGYWKYKGMRLDPAPDSLTSTGLPVKEISGGFQAEPNGNGSMLMKFVNEDAEKAKYIAELKFGFKSVSAMGTLTPGGEISIEAELSFGGNEKAASLPSDASAQIAVGNGDYLLNISNIHIGQPASAQAIIPIEGGGPGATMEIRITAYIGSYGGFSGRMILEYIWMTDEMTSNDQEEDGDDDQLTAPQVESSVFFSLSDLLVSLGLVDDMDEESVDNFEPD